MVQLHVAKRGSLTHSHNPTTALKGRIRDAGKKTGIDITAEPERSDLKPVWINKPARPSTPPDTTMLIPQDKIAGIIGRQAMVLHKLWEQSGIHYIDAKGNDAPDFWPEMR